MTCADSLVGVLNSAGLRSSKPLIARLGCGINVKVPTIPANRQERLPKSQRVIHFVCPGAKLLDVAGPLQVFRNTHEYTSNGSGYQPLIASSRGGKITTDVGVALETRSIQSLRIRPSDLIIIPGGAGIYTACEDAPTLRWLRSKSKTFRIMASTCTGAFLLGAAGLLDGKRAVTHWEACERLQARFPRAHVEQNPIYIEDAGIWTSAGVTAGIDLALAIVEADYGRQASLGLAKNLVVNAQRPGGQAQFSTALRQQMGDSRSDFASLHAWIRSNLASDLGVEKLAEQAQMAPRSFHRAFSAAHGSTPARSVLMTRIEAAQGLLEESAKGVKEIALQCGFGTEEHMRRAFQRELQLSPTDYRRLWQRRG